MERFLVIKKSSLTFLSHENDLYSHRTRIALAEKGVNAEVQYIDLDDFSSNASSNEMVGLLKGINIVAKKLHISVDTGKGYRALANISEHGGQEVPHLHFHLFGGERVGRMVE